MSATKEISFALDVAFSSATEPLPGKSENPIFAMGFGFSSLKPGGNWQEDGQKAQTILRKSPFYFCAYDTATDGAQPVTQIEIHFKKGSTPFVNPETKQPVTDPIVVEKGELASQPGQSAGCNVIGTLWLIGPYHVAGDIPDRTSFECVVTVTVENGNSFEIDPEMVVDGPNPMPPPSIESTPSDY
jgi:hypothetical protein